MLNRTTLLKASLALLTLASVVTPPASALTIYYTYGDKTGGLASLNVTPGGEVSDHKVIGEGIDAPFKIGISAKGDRALVISEENAKATLFQVGTTPKQLAVLDLGAHGKSLVSVGDHALVSADEGLFNWINLDQGTIEKTFDAKKNLNPSGTRGEGLFLMPDHKTVLVPFQKDSSKGTHFGSRMLVFDLDSMTPRFDLQLPRNHPDLHIVGNLKEQGPDPEVAFMSPKDDTVMLTLDLYGAIAFAKLSSALAGKWDNLEYIPCSMDGSWGNAFPDRGLLFTSADKDYLLISNASPNGGLVLYDVATRKIIDKYPAPGGCETPVLLSHSQKVVTVSSGKTKTRLAIKQEKVFKPDNILFVLDPAPLKDGKPATMERITFDKPVQRVQAIDPEHNDLLFLVLGTDSSELVIYDLDAKKILHREPTKGSVQRVATYQEGK
jgi:hypothetical protein